MSNEIVEEEAHVAVAAFFSIERIQPALSSPECKDDDASVPFISGLSRANGIVARIMDLHPGV